VRQRCMIVGLFAFSGVARCPIENGQTRKREVGETATLGRRPVRTLNAQLKEATTTRMLTNRRAPAGYFYLKA
jgi:hypothetical protein